MEINFKGKTALVTGASQGIGREVAKSLVKCGAKVIAISNDEKLLITLKEEHPTIDIYYVDLSDWKMTEKVLNQMGDIDLLVNNAGVVILEPLTEVSEESVDKVFAVNVKATINVTKHIVKHLVNRKKSGAIVNLSSQASVVGLNNHAVYCASKAAIDAFTRTVALEYGSYGIRINNVNPTAVMTDMGIQVWSDPSVSKPMLDKIPLKRFGKVEEVVNAILFLLSDLSSMTTGSNFYVDGGYTAV